MRARNGVKVTPIEEGAAPPGGQQPGAPGGAPAPK
jgi:hypothetical protein